MDRKKQTLSLFPIITILISLCMIAPCIIAGGYFYTTLRSNTYETLEDTLESTAEKSFSSLDSFLLSIKNTYYSIISDPVIHPELYNSIFPENSFSSSESIDERLYKMMFYSTLWNENILTSITVMYNPQTYYYISNTKQGAALDLENRTAVDMVTGTWQNLQKQLGHERIHTLTNLSDTQNSLFYLRDYYAYPDNTFKGLIGLQLNEDALLSVFDPFEEYENTLCFLYDTKENIVISSNKTLCNKTLQTNLKNNISLKSMMSDQKNYLIKKQPLTNYPLTACVLIPLLPIQQQLRQQLQGYLVIFAISLLLVIAIALFVSRYISNYINLLIKRITAFSKNNTAQSLPIYRIKEVNHLSSAFTEMSEEIQRLLKEKYANEVLLKESELKALQAQINPHFLFNTLLTISWKARANNDMESYEMITALSSLLNASIYTQNTKLIPLKEELKNVQYYLKIQKIRFGDRLSYDIDVDSRLMDRPILKLCLQPLVENAVVHGLENKIENGNIFIFGDITENDEMLIQIIDNGVGFNTQNLTQKMETTPDEDDRKGHHIGLINTHLRLKYIYGEQYGLIIKSTPGNGTTVSVKLPLS